MQHPPLPRRARVVRLLPLALLLAPPSLAQRAIYWNCEHNGDAWVAEYGRAVSFAGDVDGDGLPDLVVGAPTREALSGELVGAVYLPGGLGLVEGNAADDRLGFAVLGGLDLDGDAVPDVLAGAPGDDTLAAEGGCVVAVAGADGSLLYTVHGQVAGGQLGSSLARVGDVDGDGRDDFLAGAPKWTSAGRGAAHLYSGATGASIRAHAGSAAGDALGMGLVGLGDVDGDGTPDYAVGAPGARVGGNAKGRVVVHSGADGSALSVHEGEDAGDQFGFALGSGSDLDRDGTDELFVGAPQPGAGPGYVRVIDGRSGAEGVRFEGEAAGDWFGASVAGAGDFDGDGSGDVVIGAPHGDPFGAIHTSGSGRASVFSGADGSVLARMGGSSAAGLGVAVAGGADADGDGLDDVAIGGRMANDGYGMSSCVVVLARTRAGRVERNESGSFSAFGTSVAGVGDLDGDGLGDALIGAPHGAAGRGRALVLSVGDGRVLWEGSGDATGDRLGQAVANAGDVDGDGVADLLVGSASLGSFDTGGAGYAKLYSGRSGAELAHLEGPGTVAFGGAVAGGADVDGDGFDDVIVGGARVDLNGSSSGSWTDVGQVRVFSGRTGALVHTFDGAQDANGYGASVALVDDLDADGRADLLIGVPGRPVGSPYFTIGEVELRSGADGSLLHVFRVFDVRLGTALCTPGDLNGDGVPDLVVSAWDPQALWSYGAVYAFSGSDQEPLWMVFDEVPYTGPSFGFSLAPAGDYDGDGIPDLMVGVPGTITAYGASIGSAEVRSGVDGARLATFQGYSGWDYFGYTVAGLGDSNGDGRPDVAIGAPTEPGNEQGADTGLDRVHFDLRNHLERYSYCPAVASSSGEPATLSLRGLGSIALNDLQLGVRGLPAGKPGIFFLGPNVRRQVFHESYLCVGGQLRRLQPVIFASAEGTAWRDLDLASPTSPILPGSQWSFQFWFRDPAGAGVHLSDAVRARFLP